MPTAHRIVKARHASTASSGEDARIAGGRWNLPGEAVVCAPGSLALAAIATFIALGDDALHIEFVDFRLEIPDAVAIQRCRPPPPVWRAEPTEEASMRYCSRWLR